MLATQDLHEPGRGTMTFTAPYAGTLYTSAGVLFGDA